MTDLTVIIKRLRFHHLELVRTIADCGTLGQAAERLHLSKPAVSKALQEIEDTLGCILFERSAKGMQPTSAGSRVIRHAHLLLNELQHMVVESDIRDVHGLLRLGMSPFLWPVLAPPLIKRLNQKHAQGHATVQASEGWLAGLVERLLAGELDVVLALYSPQAVGAFDLSSLTVEPLREEHMVVVAPSHLAGVPQIVEDWCDLVELPWILPSAPTHLRRTVEETFLAAGCRPPLPVIESPVLTTNLQLAAAGLGLTVVPATAAEPEAARGRLRVLSIPRALPTTYLALIYRRVSAAYLPWIGVVRDAAVELFSGS